LYQLLVECEAQDEAAEYHTLRSKAAVGRRLGRKLEPL
jgi:hypothetical protein